MLRNRKVATSISTKPGTLPPPAGEQETYDKGWKNAKKQDR
jgi:hypothetical protein